jgi:flagellar basal body P-ring protein FlgI
MSPWRPLAWSLLFGLSVSGAFTYLSASSKADKDEESTEKKYETKVDTPMIGDYTTFSGLQPVVIEGVGLVVGLNGTGGDPAPSFYRTELMNEMKRRGVPNPNQVLQSPNTALVLVRAYLPPLMKKGETIDLEVRLPESADASSLAGGWLMETYLSEQAIVPNRSAPLHGHAYAKASGAILTAGVGSDAVNSPELLKRGRILGGATVMKERELALFLRYDFRSVRNSQRLADVIGRRFHDFDEYGIKKPMAKAKTDQKIVLNVHPRYKDNYPRYLQVIRHLAFRETPVGTRVRIQKLQQEIYNAERAEECSLELEAIGNEGIPVLKQALTSPLLEVRFYAATALAYLGEADGLEALKESALKERAFRVFSLAAISTLDEADAHIALRELMSEPGAEMKYGAFRSLWTLDKKDPFIRGEMLGVRDEGEDKPKNRAGAFMLHTLQTTGDPMIHTLTRTRPEIVLFGANQEFRPPLYLSAGRHIIITSQPGDNKVSLAKFQVGQQDQRREVSLQIADVIRAADELGATYPDIVQMLADASKQKNLPTRLAIDELPEGGRVYYRPNSSGEKKRIRTKVGKHNMTPNLFPEQEEPPAPGAERKKEEPRGNMANVTEESTQKSKDKDKHSDEKSSKETSSKSSKSTSRPSREDSKKETEKKGMFSWLGSWTKDEK